MFSLDFARLKLTKNDAISNALPIFLLSVGDRAIARMILSIVLPSHLSDVIANAVSIAKYGVDRTLAADVSAYSIKYLVALCLGPL